MRKSPAPTVHAAPLRAGAVARTCPLLGLRVGEVARWSTPDGRTRAAEIVALLFQPEASGDYTL